MGASLDRTAKSEEWLYHTRDTNIVESFYI